MLFLVFYYRSSDILTPWLNMLKTLQFQSAHSAGSTQGSTAVCALQVLLVITLLLFINLFTLKVGILVGLRGVLLVCSQLLLVSAVQIHAKLSVSQACSQKDEMSPSLVPSSEHLHAVKITFTTNTSADDILKIYTKCK